MLVIANDKIRFLMTLLMDLNHSSVIFHVRPVNVSVEATNGNNDNLLVY